MSESVCVKYFNYYAYKVRHSSHLWHEYRKDNKGEGERRVRGCERKGKDKIDVLLLGFRLLSW